MKNTRLSSGLGWIWGVALAAAVTGGAGCSRPVAVLDAEERDHPALQRAKDALQQGDVDRAAELYRDVLDEYPRLALAHMDYALMLHDAKKDYLGATYHYRRYLELRPQTEKLTIIQGRMRLAQQLYAAQLVPQDPQMGDKVRLAQENESLRMEVVRLKRELEVSTNRVVVSTPVVSSVVDTGRVVAVVAQTGNGGGGKAVKSGAATPSAQRTYKVKAGDTLSSIAAEVYSDRTRWTKISEANRRALGGSTSLKPGQILIIP